MMGKDRTEEDEGGGRVLCWTSLRRCPLNKDLEQVREEPKDPQQEHPVSEEHQRGQDGWNRWSRKNRRDAK